MELSVTIRKMKEMKHLTMLIYRSAVISMTELKKLASRVLNDFNCCSKFKFNSEINNADSSIGVLIIIC